MKPQTQTKNQNLIKFLDTLNLDIDFNAFILDDDDINDFDDLQAILDDNNALSVDIIYYSEAIKFLAENDNSLKDSINLASELGYDIKNVNSEMLASLLATELLRNELNSYEGEINDYINELNDLINE